MKYLAAFFLASLVFLLGNSASASNVYHRDVQIIERIPVVNVEVFAPHNRINFKQHAIVEKITVIEPVFVRKQVVEPYYYWYCGRRYIKNRVFFVDEVIEQQKEIVRILKGRDIGVVEQVIIDHEDEILKLFNRGYRG